VRLYAAERVADSVGELLLDHVEAKGSPLRAQAISRICSHGGSRETVSFQVVAPRWWWVSRAARAVNTTAPTALRGVPFP
jgi:hypothetical protein